MASESSTLFQIIENIIDKKMRKISFDKDGLIIGSETEGVYAVAIDGYKYNVKNGTTWNFNKGDKCLVHYINGNENNKVIIAKL